MSLTFSLLFPEAQIRRVCRVLAFTFTSTVLLFVVMSHLPNRTVDDKGGATSDEGVWIPLWKHSSRSTAPNRSSTTQGQAYLVAFLPEARVRCTAIVVFPGGAYCEVGVHGAHVARQLQAAGLCSFVLNYRYTYQFGFACLPFPATRLPMKFGTNAPLEDAMRAVRVVRGNAARWKINPSRIGVLGISAGGHLAASLAVHHAHTLPELAFRACLVPWEPSAVVAGDPWRQVSPRPDFLVLVFSVITMRGEFAHLLSRWALLGINVSKELADYYSAERHVTPDTPPSLLIHSRNDTVVSFMNSVLFHEACVRAGVPSDLRLLPGYGHAMPSLTYQTREERDWLSLVPTWLHRRGLLKPSR